MFWWSSCVIVVVVSLLKHVLLLITTAVNCKPVNLSSASLPVRWHSKNQGTMLQSIPLLNEVYKVCRQDLVFQPSGRQMIDCITAEKLVAISARK